MRVSSEGRNCWSGIPDVLLITKSPSFYDVIPHSLLSVSLFSLSHAHTPRVYSSFKQKEKTTADQLFFFRTSLSI